MNARKELQKELHDIGKTMNDVKYLYVRFEKPLYTTKAEDICEFQEKGNFDLSILDFDYDVNYGSQQLYGYVVFADGSWLERNNEDEDDYSLGDEWWEYKKTPTKEDLEMFLKEGLENQQKKKENLTSPKPKDRIIEILTKTFNEELGRLAEKLTASKEPTPRKTITSLYQGENNGGEER
jgi:hypothetical protein